MFLPEIKEREYRFRLALRMGLPIFALMFALIFHTVITTYNSLNFAFYLESLILLIFGIYFIFYLIYSGFETKITDDVSKVFTRTYLYKYLKNDLTHNKNYTLLLVSVENLNDINKLYGIKSGDKVLYELGLWINNYFKNNNIHNFPIGHVKGGDFIIGLKGSLSENNTLIDLLCLKMGELKIDHIEVKISTAKNDTRYFNDLDYMVENLFEIQDRQYIDEKTDPNELESYVINAIGAKTFILMQQNIYKDTNLVMRECFVKLKKPDGKFIYPKSYIKILNKLRLMHDYDYMILEQMVQHSKEENDLIYAINISPISLRNQNFISKVKALIDNNQHLKDKIMFILSEKEYYSHIDKYREIIKTVRNFGVKITIDKIGSYHSSFLYFRELKIDAIRIDGSYSKEIDAKNYKNILEGFSNMAKNSDVKVWLKMIQSKEILDQVQNIEADYMQGKYLSDLEIIHEN